MVRLVIEPIELLIKYKLAANLPTTNPIVAATAPTTSKKLIRIKSVITIVTNSIEVPIVTGFV